MSHATAEQPDGARGHQHTADEAVESREHLRRDLGAGRVHLAEVLVVRSVDWWLESAVIGDLLCWCPYMTEDRVTKVLEVLNVNWGRRVGMVTEREKDALLKAIHDVYPRIWAIWRGGN